MVRACVCRRVRVCVGLGLVLGLVLDLVSVGLRLRLPLGLVHSVWFSSRRCALVICVDALALMH
jgi:hypothetical protein